MHPGVLAPRASHRQEVTRQVVSATIEVPAEIAGAVAEMGRFAAARGWVPATSGNFSVRLGMRHIAITRSGADKGRLAPGDVVAVCLDEPIPPGVSAETPLHVARYRADASIGAVMHVHTVAATVLSRGAGGSVVVEGLEMQKALPGITTHDGSVAIPVFQNAQDTAALALEVEKSLKPGGVPGYLLAGHGMYAWGKDAAEARRHVEALEFLLVCTLEERRLGR